MSKKDYYEILGVAKDANAQAIKKAYHKIALRDHPDKNPGDKSASDRFKEVTEAYHVLSNSEKRAHYDAYGHDSMTMNGGQGGRQYHNANFEDIIQDFFGHNHRNSVRRPQGPNMRIKIKATLQEVVKGISKRVKVKRYIACQSCQGSGAAHGAALKMCTTCKGSGQESRVTTNLFMRFIKNHACSTCGGVGRVIKTPCSSCHGEGRSYKEIVEHIEIPPGVQDGMEFSITGKGHAPTRGGIPGDLIIAIETIEDEQLRREGDNLHYKCYISFLDATFGAKAKVPLVDGQATIVIAAGTQSGHIVRLKGKGLPNTEGYGWGDLFVHLYVWTPQNMAPTTRAKLEALRETKDLNPKGDLQHTTSFFDKIKSLFS